MHPLSYFTKTKYHLLSDSRILSYQEFGDRDGTPVFYSHTTAGSKIEGEFYQEAALKFGIRLICIDRPGMGDSSYLPKRTLLDYPQDVIELADELKLAKFGLIGWSGGASYTLAVSFKYPNRILFCILIAGYTNFVSSNEVTSSIPSSIDKLIAMNYKKYPKLLKVYLELFSFTVKTLPKLSLKTIAHFYNQSDRAIIARDKVKSILFRTQREAYKEGSQGPTKDIAIHYSDWGFQLEDIEIFVDILHGKEDQVVPIYFSQFNQKLLPSCKLEILENEGHFFPCVSSHQIFSLAAKKALDLKAIDRSTNRE